MKAAWILLVALLAGCGSGPERLWEIEVGKPGQAAPAVAAQAVAVALDEGVVAINLQTGAQLWAWKPEPKAYGVVGLRALRKDRLAVLASGRLIILSMKDGSELWSSNDGGTFLGEPKGDLLPFSGAGVVQVVNFDLLLHAGNAETGPGREGAEAAFVGDALMINAKDQENQGALVAYNPREASTFWTAQSNSPFFGPALALGEVAVVVQNGGDTPTAVGIDAHSGNLRWRHVFNSAEANKPRYRPPAAMAGLVGVFAFQGARAERLVGLSPEGDQKWLCHMDWFIPDNSMTPPLSYGPGVCIAAGDRLVAVDDKGQFVWKKTLQGPPLVGMGFSQGILVTLNQSGHVMALRLPE